MITYIWQVGDEEWLVAARFLAQSGAPSTRVLVDLIHQQNAATIYDWARVPPGVSIQIPASQQAAF